MTAFRILHVDDEPDIREIVELSLGLDPAFRIRSCGSGSEALAIAVDWLPDLILCDVMMPGMDGPATLARLRKSAQTAETPVIFMTARVQTRELEHLKSLGADGVIAKPFDPMTLASWLRQHLRSAGLATLRTSFIERMRSDAKLLAGCRAGLRGNATSPQLLAQIQVFAHALAGSAGIFNFPDVSLAASALETAVIEQLAGACTSGKVAVSLDTLLDCMARAGASSAIELPGSRRKCA